MARVPPFGRAAEVRREYRHKENTDLCYDVVSESIWRRAAWAPYYKCPGVDSQPFILARNRRIARLARGVQVPGAPVAIGSVTAAAVDGDSAMAGGTTVGPPNDVMNMLTTVTRNMPTIT